MVLNYNQIVKIQKELDNLCKPYGGYSDGWGVFVD
ncbi:ribonuclease E inhibitor RraB [Neobacillus sp. PS2-9]|nr:ribonuclease E inhibitor RraB [Neobacillus sp. PS2-9]WML56058.1 ribonuclease E inhibitor RraB [Neobacillus sp. PS2-9]